MSLLSVQNVSFTYPQSQKKALNNINFSVENGEYIAIVGTNGSGKSTLARIIAEFISSDNDGKVISSEQIIKGIVFQQPKEQIVAGTVSRDTAFGPQNLLRENKFHDVMTKKEIELRTIECLSLTGLLDKANSRTFELSLGQTQRLAYSGVLALFPDILILDEVSAMLDPDARKDILALTDNWNKKGHAVITITHDKTEALNANRIIVLDKGTIVFDGTKELFVNKKELVNMVFGDDDWYVNNKKNYNQKTDNSKNSICINNLSFSYDTKNKTNVFNNITLSLKKNTLNALTGPNGCGKSTLLECLAGLQKNSSGTITSLSRPSLALQESEAAIFEQFASDDVAFGPSNNGLKGKQLVERVKNSMNMVGLPYNEFKDCLSYSLSGGEKRKLALAGIIALDSEVMLFDEPTAGLDSSSRQRIMLTLRQLADSGKTVLFVTHRQEEAKFADREIKWQEFNTQQIEVQEIEKTNNNLTKQEPYENSKMITSIRNITNSFLAPPLIPDSLVNRMPPVLKYLVMLTLFISSLAVRPLWLCSIMFAVCVLYTIVAKYPLKKPIVGFLKITPWLCFFAIIQMLFFPVAQNDVVFFQVSFITVSLSKIFLILCTFIRTASAMFCIGTFIFTTSEREIVDGLDDLLKPLSLLKIPVRYVVLVVGIIFRFIPLLLDEAIGILKTQIVRGGFGKVKGFAKVRSILPLLIPLIVQTFRKAEIFADSLTARYFN